MHPPLALAVAQLRGPAALPGAATAAAAAAAASLGPGGAGLGAAGSLAAAAGYALAANYCYLSRRSHLRSAHDPAMTRRRLLRIRTERERGVSARFHVVLVLAWQLFVLVAYPWAEPLARLYGRTVFYYTYPNAHGMGLILEPLDRQHLPPSGRARSQIRLDWHRFAVNVGPVGRDGYRHPPSVELNRPHLDVPERRMRHWPWRRRWGGASAGGGPC